MNEWCQVPLGDLLTEPKDRKIPEDSDMRYVGMEHIDPERTRIVRWAEPSTARSTSKVFRKNDVLFGRLRPYLKKVALADFDGVCSGEILVLRPNANVSPGFLYMLAANGTTSKHAVEVSAGSRMPRVASKDLLALEVPLPPRLVQERIVEVIDAVDDQITALDVEADALSKVESGIRRDLFSKLEVSTVAAGEIFEMTLGRQKSARQSVGDHVHPYLRAANIGVGTIDLRDLRTMNFEPREQVKYAVLPEDVLLVEGGSIGQAAIWSDEIEGFLGFDKHLIRVRARVGISTPEYALQWCHWARETGQFAAQATGITIKALGFSRASSMGVPSLSVGQQDMLTGSLVAMSAQVTAKRAESDRLRQVRAGLLSGLLNRTIDIKSAELEV